MDGKFHIHGKPGDDTVSSHRSYLHLSTTKMHLFRVGVARNLCWGLTTEAL